MIKKVAKIVQKVQPYKKSTRKGHWFQANTYEYILYALKTESSFYGIWESLLQEDSILSN